MKQEHNKTLVQSYTIQQLQIYDNAARQQYINTRIH